MAGPFDDLIPDSGGTAVAAAPTSPASPAPDNPFADLIPQPAAKTPGPFDDLIPAATTPPASDYDPLAPENLAHITEGNPMGLLESIQRKISPLLGPTESQLLEQSIPFGKKDAQGNPVYEYKPLADRMTQQGLAGAGYLDVKPMPAKPGDSPVSAAGKAIFNTAAGVENSILSPFGVMTGGVGGEIPMAGRIIGGAFATDMAVHIPKQLDQMVHGATVQEKLEGGLGAIVGLLTAGFAGTHALAGEHPSLESVIHTTRQELDKVAPPNTPLTKTPLPIDDQTLDGLVQTRASLADGMVKGKVSSETAQPMIDHIDDTLLQADRTQVRASEERIAQQRAQTPAPEGPSVSAANSYADRTAKIQEEDRRATPEERTQNQKDKEDFRKEVSKGDKINVQKESIDDQGIKTTSTETYTVDDEGDRLVAYPDSGGPSLGLEPDSGFHFFNTVGAEIQGGQVVRRSVTIEKAGKKGGTPERTAPASEEAPPVTPEVPPAKGGTSSLFRQAQAEAGVTEQTPFTEKPSEPFSPLPEGKITLSRYERENYDPNTPDPTLAEMGVPDEARGNWFGRNVPEYGGPGKKLIQVTLDKAEAEKYRVGEDGFVLPKEVSEKARSGSEPEPITDPAMHQAALDSAERIATQVTQGQGDIVQRAARDAAYDKIKKNMDAGQPTMSFVRETAKAAAGDAVKKAGVSLDAEKTEGQTVGDTMASEEPTPAQAAAKADMIDAVQKQVETLPAGIQKTAKAFLEAAQNGESTSLRDLGKKLGVSQQTVANHLKAMRDSFGGLKEEGYSVGPGAASISEQLGETLLSIKNASTEAGRKAAGLPERDAVGRQTFGDIWDHAQKAFDEDPDVGKKLVDELKEKSRPLTDREDAILTHELGDRQQEYDEALHEVSEARTPSEHSAAKTRLDNARDALHQVYDASERAGTENARGLGARRMMVKSDYSMVGVERKLRDNLGRDLTDEERTRLEKPVQEAEKADEKAKAAEEDFTKSQEDAETQHFVEATINELGKSYLEKPAYGKKVFDIARGIVDRWKEEAKTAHDDLRKALGSANAGIPNPAIVLHVAKILRAKIGEFGLDKTEAFAEMVQEYGPKVQEHLEKGWKQAKALIAGEKGDSKAKEIAAKGVSKKGEKTPAEAKAEAKAEKVAGEKLSQKTIVDHVRALINAGEHDTNKLMAKTTEAMKEHFPDVTERDVRRAFVDYGKKIFPSKDAVETEIRENKQIVKIQEDIDREMEGQRGVVNPETGELMGAEKQGYQRDKATQKVRDLIKQRNELLKKRQGPDSPEKLASTQAARRTALENAIADTDRELKTGEKRAKTEAAPDDVHNEQLRAELKAMRDKVKEIDAEQNPGKTEAEKQEASLQKQLDAANAELAGTKEKSSPKEWKALSQKAEDLKAQLDSVRQLKKELEAKPERTPDDIEHEKAQKGVDAAAAALDKWDRILKGEIPRDPAKAKEWRSQLEEDMQSQVAAMKKAADDIRRSSLPKTDRDKATLKALEKSIADYERRVRDSDFSSKAKPTPSGGAAVQAARALRDAAKKVYDDLKKAQKPVKTPEERYNETRMKAVQKTLAEKQAYLDQLKKTGVVPSKPPKVDKVKFAAVAKAEADLTAKKREIDNEVRRIVFENRSTPQKIKEGAANVLKAVTAVKVLGHGTVGMFTHAGGLAWRPDVAKTFWTNFGKQFKLWTSKAFHEQAIYKLTHDADYQAWKDAGASIDPEKTYTDYGLYAKWLGKLGEAGGRGFDALKITRLELNKANWEKVPDSVKNDPVAAAETRKAIADINNKATGAIPQVSPVTPEGAPNRITNGVYNLAKNPLADAVFFAPKLYASRWARVVLDPIKTVGTLADWKNASIADKTAAKIRMKNAGIFAATYLGALLINKGLLKASGSNQDVNITDPTKPDWLKFKAGGKEIIADGGLLDPIRLLGQIIVGDIINDRTKSQQYREGTRFQKVTQDLAKYARSKFNPTLGLVVDSATGTDYAGKPLPWSKETPKFKDQGKYTWGEWLMQQGPIPVSQGVKVAYDEMRKNGMSHVQIMQILKGAAVAAIGGTGVHVTEDHPAKPQSKGRKR